MQDVLFSVIMSVYKNDNAEYLDKAIKSIMVEQTVCPNELVLVVDGPIPDGINQVIDKYEREYSTLNVVRLKENGGLGNALEVALDNASFEYVARMDSDDISLPTRFEEQIRIIQNDRNIDIIGGDISEFIDTEDNIVGKRILPVSHEAIKNYMKSRCAMNHVTVMFKKSSVKKVGGYIDWFYNEDYYLWLRMLKGGMRFANTGTVLVNVRVGKEMYKRRGGFKYFQSEKGIQKYMLSTNMINYYQYIRNVIVRFVVQVVMPNSIREWFFIKIARRH